MFVAGVDSENTGTCAVSEGAECIAERDAPTTGLGTDVPVHPRCGAAQIGGWAAEELPARAYAMSDREAAPARLGHPQVDGEHTIAETVAASVLADDPRASRRFPVVPQPMP